MTAPRLPSGGDATWIGVMLLSIGFASQAASFAPERPRSYGEAQLEVIFQDRPQLAAILVGRGDLQDWLVRELGRDDPEPLWDPSEPVTGRAAEHEYPSRGGTVPEGTALIRVSSKSSGWDQLAGLVFELHNLRHSARFAAIQQAAESGEIDKAEYVQQLLQQEFAALVATRKFLSEHATDVPESAKDGDTLFGHILETEDTLEAHLRKYDRNGSDLTAHFEQLYEREVVPAMRRSEGTGREQ